jgi:putative transposase
MERRVRQRWMLKKPFQEQTFMKLLSGSHSIGQNLYHLEWCPKYRYNMFKREENKNLCEEILHEVAQRHQIKITEMSVMPDHIHLVVELKPTMSVSQAFHLLKGASSRELFKQKPAFRNRYSRGHFWSPGKFYRTVGDADAETVIKYVRDHRLQQTSLNGFA